MLPGKTFSKSEIIALMDSVKAEFKNITAAELEKLSKSEGSSSSSTAEGSLGKATIPAEGSLSSSSSEGSAPPMSGEGSSPSAGSAGDAGDASMPPPGAEGSAPPGMDESAPPAAPSAGPDGAPPPGADGGMTGIPMEELVGLYVNLPDQDFDAHMAAMQQAAIMRQGGTTGAPPAGAPSAPPSPSAPPMGKQEVATHNPNIGLAAGGGTPGKVETHNPNIGPTKKSEDEMGQRLSKAEEAVDVLVKVVDALTSTPVRKAQTGLTYIPYQGALQKTEQTKPLKKSVSDMTRDELTKELMRVTSQPTLSKSDRDTINGFYNRSSSVTLADIEAILNK